MWQRSPTAGGGMLLGEFCPPVTEPTAFVAVKVESLPML